jgi:tetratricopeptide (TPR) repeat protein
MQTTAWVLYLTLLPAAVAASPASLWDQRFSDGERLEQQGQHAAAGLQFEAALTVAEQLGPEDWRLPLTLHNLGTVARELGRYPESERYYERAVSIWETHHPQRVAERAGTLQNLGALNMVWGRYPRAELNYRGAYELRLSALGPGHPDVGASLHGLAELAAARRRYAEAEDLYRQAAAILEPAYGPDSLKVANLWHNWGFLYAQMHRYEAARPLLERAAAVYDSRLPNHPNMAVLLHNLAQLDMNAGDLTHAGERLERALAICEKSLPPDHEQTGVILGTYGKLLEQTNRKKEAKLAAGKARAILAKGAKESGTAYTVDASSFLGNR